MATRVIDDSKLQNIAVAIQSKDNGGQMTVEEMPGRIEAIPSSAPVVSNPALVLWDWEGTKLAEYSREDALALTELPALETLFTYAGADHELLVFQSWNWSLADIKAWVQEHRNTALNVGAIYTTTDGQNHTYWNSPRLVTANTMSMQKRGTTRIGAYEFQNYHSLTQINIPNGVASIGANAFYACNSLTQINIPDGTASIGDYAFAACTSLIQINIPNGTTSIGANAFQNCTSLTQINIPNGVASIGASVFSGCSSLTQISIPNGVTSIGTSAFLGCSSLTQISIPNGVASIGANAFYGCTSLIQINIPNGTTSIGANAFQNCETLCDILNESKSTLSNANAFAATPSIYRVYVPRENLSWYETATNWAAIYTQGHIVAIEDYIDYLESIGFNVDKYKEAA